MLIIKKVHRSSEYSENLILTKFHVNQMTQTWRPIDMEDALTEAATMFPSSKYKFSLVVNLSSITDLEDEIFGPNIKSLL